MTDQSVFPLSFVAARCGGEFGTPKGVYLRWAPHSFLGIPGVWPNRGSSLRPHGFRVFYMLEKMPPTEPVPAGEIEEDGKGLYGDVLKGVAHDWRVILSRDRGTAKARIMVENVPYLRFAYRLFPGQELILRVKKRLQTEVSEEMIPLHFPRLFEGPGAPAYRDLVVAVHVDHVRETIEGAWLQSNKSIFVGAVQAGRSQNTLFWVWSPAERGLWKEVEQDQMLVHAPRDPHFGPVPADDLRDQLLQFYAAYYGVGPVHDAADHISFMPRDNTGDLPVPPDDQPLDLFEAKDYRRLLEDEPSEAAERLARWQQLVPLIAMRPAGAHALGLFRVLKEAALPVRDGCTFKVQGTWPGGRRYCAYYRYDPQAVLPGPSIAAVEATAAVERRALQDYRTSRTHYPLRVVRLSARPRTSGKRPAGLVVFRHQTGAPNSQLLKSHFVPAAGDEEARLVDDHEHYPNTDIPRVLDGAYRYYAFGFDLFGQRSAPGDAMTTVTPRPLRPDGVERVGIDFPRVPCAGAPGEDTQLDLPIEIEPSEARYRLKVTGSSWMPLDVSFFWPPEAAYRWNSNRGKGVPSTRGFRLYYGIDTLPSVPLHGVIGINGPEGVEIAVDGISGSGSNGPLYHLLRRLGVTTSSGLSVGAVTTILEGGSVSVGTALKIAAVTDITSTSLRLRCVRFEQAERDEVARQGFDLGLEALRERGDLDAEIGWNQDAQSGAQWMGWKRLAQGALLLLPETMEERRKIVASVTTPGISVAQSENGVSAYKAGTAEGFAFRVELPRDHRLASHRTLLITPLPADGSEPGETVPSRADRDQVTIPRDVDKVFSDRLVRSFYIERVDGSGDKDLPVDVAVYRGKAHIAEQGAAGERYALLPDKGYQRWRITPPVEKRVNIPLSELLLGAGFEENTHKATLRVAVETVADRADNEVENALQEAKAQQKLVFVRDVRAGSVVVEPPAPPAGATAEAPSFGISALAPDFYGRSLVTLEAIYDGYELETQLRDDLSYDLYRLPAGRLAPNLVTRYAWDGSRYRRNLQTLTAIMYPDSGPTGLKLPAVADAFESFAVRATESSLSKEALLAMCVELPGDTRTVFLYALRPYDAAAGRHGPFAALSPPVYVEDGRPPVKPRAIDPVVRYQQHFGPYETDDRAVQRHIRTSEPMDRAGHSLFEEGLPPSDPHRADVVARIRQHAGTLSVDVRVPRNLVVPSETFDKTQLMQSRLTRPPTPLLASPSGMKPSPSAESQVAGVAALRSSNDFPTARFDKVSHGYLSDPTIKGGFFLGPNFRNITARYWLYLTTVNEVVLRPDESDFRTYKAPLEFTPPSAPDDAGLRLSIRVPPTSIALAPSPPHSLMLTAALDVASREAAQLLPHQLYLCVRAENYLGTLSGFDFTPVPVTILH